jgi:predicted nucleic acid-binding Zn ribbon protein
MSDPVPITDSLDSVMRSLRGTDRAQIAGVFGRWEEAVGAVIAAHLRPVKLDLAVLTVEADDAAWATEAKFVAGQVIERLRTVAGVRVERLEVRVAGARRSG